MLNNQNFIIVYVELLDEGTDTWRPTQAENLGNGLYRLLATEEYDSEDELWAFLPGDVIALKQTRFADGTIAFAAKHPDPNMIPIDVEQESGPFSLKRTNARHLGDGVYEVLATPQYNPANEQWKFPPGSKVRLKEKTIGGGFTYLIAGETA